MAIQIAFERHHGESILPTIFQKWFMDGVEMMGYFVSVYLIVRKCQPRS